LTKRPKGAARDKAATQARWQHLVQAAFVLEEQAGGPNGLPATALSVVDSGLEVFNSGIDPIEDFEGYAVRRLLLALRTALGK